MRKENRERKNGEREWRKDEERKRIEKENEGRLKMTGERE